MRNLCGKHIVSIGQNALVSLTDTGQYSKGFGKIRMQVSANLEFFDEVRTKPGLEVITDMSPYPFRNFHKLSLYITVLCLINLLIHFKYYNAV